MSSTSVSSTTEERYPDQLKLDKGSHQYTNDETQNLVQKPPSTTTTEQNNSAQNLEDKTSSYHYYRTKQLCS